MDLYPNAPKTLAESLGIPSKVHHQRCRGGDGAVGTSTIMAQRIADGADGAGGLILLSGAMNASTIAKVVKDASGQTLRGGTMGYDKTDGLDTLSLLKQKLGHDPAGGVQPEFS